MGNYEQLKQAVSDVIKTNGNQEITGAILQNALLTIISTIGNNSTFAGIATPTTNPGTPDANVFYITGTSGLYSNFSGIIVEIGEAVILEWRGSWEKKVIDLATSESLKSLNNALKGEPYAVSNNIRNAFTYLGNFVTWAEAQTELDKLHSLGEDNTKIGSFRMLLNGRNIEVNNWVQSWATGVFTQMVQGSIQWNDESQTMDQSLSINTYERRYNGGTGWTTWEEGNAKIELAQELSTEEGSEKKAISQKAVSEALSPLQNLGIFIELVYTEVVDGKVMTATGTEKTGTDYIYAKYSIPDGVSNLKINARAYGQSYPYAVLRKSGEIVGAIDNTEGGSSVVKELLIESKGADEICVNGIKSNASTPKCYYQSTNSDLITREEVERNYVKNSRGIEHTENTTIILADENSGFTENYAIDGNGTIMANENYDITDYINVEGISAIYMSKGAYTAVGFYKEESEDSIVSVADFTSAETPINVPIQAKYARFNNRKILEGTFTVSYIGSLTKISIKNVYAEDKTLDEYISNKILEANITPNKVFFGKRFSVIGDSIGVYPYSEDSEVTEDDMWWKIAIDYFNGTKGVISCVAGTSVADSTGSDTTAFVNRISTLNLSNTDVLFIEGGMNDLGFKNVALGDFDFSTLLSEQEKTTFVPAYRKMIEYIQSTYPNIKIVICTITPRNPFPVSENFPWKNSTTQNTWIEYNEAIRKLADCYGCYLADISKCGLTFFNVEEYTKDGVHPLKVGQNMIGQRVIMDLK